MDELLLLAWKIPLFADWKMLWKEKKKEIQGIFYLFIFFFEMVVIIIIIIII